MPAGTQARRRLRSSLQQHGQKNVPRTTAARKAATDHNHSHEHQEERIQREAERTRRKAERRLEDLERGQAGSVGWNDHAAVPALSTSAAAIAGLLAGKQAADHTLDDLPTPQGASASSASNRSKKQSAELKRLLNQRRNLKALLEDANTSSEAFRSAPINFLSAVRVRSRYPLHRSTAPVCTVCGYWGDVTCMRCGERTCGLRCSTT